MFAENQLLPLSALQHLLFCERQCALIHIERLWADNVLTVEGNILHEQTHNAGQSTRGDIHVARGLPLRSLELGLTGIADVVEFHRENEDTPAEFLCTLPNRKGRWIPFPVEYKRGKPKRGSEDTVQLCAQALCLEEMLGTTIRSGALFYGKIRRRTDVPFTAELRRQTQTAATRLHQIINAGQTPQAAYGKHCKNCSLAAQCMPKTARSSHSVARYLAAQIKAAADAPPQGGNQ